MKTRYRVLQNQITLEYKIQYQVFRLTILGKHWKRKWIDYCFSGDTVELFITKEKAISKIYDFKNCDVRARNQRHRRKKFLKTTKKDKYLQLWRKVYP